ncbi:hypothetical protein [Herbaspirillum sp. NPDC101397]|uniref:hypothetical protein n=1 Tax=Herbaspirillum sp. NPDC101397 TaxID=3364006 RepID=UPI003839F7CA
MTQSSVSLGLPWKLPYYRPLNGFHPLVESFIKNNPSSKIHVVNRALNPDDSIAASTVFRLSEQTRSLNPEQALNYVNHLNIFDQLCIEAQSEQFEMLFQHTAPMYCGAKPWIFHFESLPSIFMPFIRTGKTSGITLRDKDYFKKIKAEFASDQCLAIFTHIAESRAIFERVFDTPRITDKLHYIPLGIDIIAPEKALDKFQSPKALRILFTNSLHQDPTSFYIRGGHHLLKAFRLIRRDHPQVELTILSSVPQDIEKWFTADDLVGVTWIQDRVDDLTLENLYLTHHIFALPTAGLHSFSILRALASGCIPLISDAPGYEEYAHNLPDSILRIHGVREQVYHDHAEGWLQDNYLPFIEAPSAHYITQIHQQILQNSNFDLLRVMAMRNLLHCKMSLAPTASHNAFNKMLETLS